MHNLFVDFFININIYVYKGMCKIFDPVTGHQLSISILITFD